MSQWTEADESILYLHDTDLDARCVVRLHGGLRADHLESDLQHLERRARLIIERYKQGDWGSDETPQLPDQYCTDDG